MELLPGGEILSEDRESIQERRSQYSKRAAALRTSTFAQKLPEVLVTHLDNGQFHATDTNSEIPSIAPGHTMSSTIKTAANVLDIAISACQKAKTIEEEYQVGSKIVSAGRTVGDAAAKAVETAKYVEGEYHVSERVVDSVKATAKAANQIEKEYQISSQIASASRSAYYYACECEERYHIQERAAALSRETWVWMREAGVQAYELERKHQLSERAWAGLREGLATTSDVLQRVSSGQWSFGAACPAQAAPALPPNAQV
mmetsp:Transcript_51533/g.134625  ORF Transcript_51533/g.134625 Transcript_51533/m.134625 type:complete len:259 (+) Transcript_51533:217-993(+)